MSDYLWIDDRAAGFDSPYDAFLTQRLLNNANHVFESRGNHVDFQWDVRTADDKTKHFRPFCSVTRWLTILRVPYFVSPGLRRLNCSMLARISNAHIETHGEKSTHTELPLEMRVTIDSDLTGAGGRMLRPRLGLNSAAELDSLWGWYPFEYEVGAEILSSFGGAGGLTYLNVEIRSQTRSQQGDIFADSSGNDHDYVMAAWKLHAGSGGDLLRVDGAPGFFSEGAAPIAPAPLANEAIALATMRRGEGNTVFTRENLYDPVLKWPGGDDQVMRVDGPPYTYQDDTWLLKVAASYIQPVTFEFFEVYQ